jgi:hypothetical protein
MKSNGRLSNSRKPKKKKKNYKMRPNKAGKEADLKGFSSQSPSLYVQMKSPLA